MQLVEFQGQVGTKNAFAIRAKDLDGNFRRLKPLTNGQYGINETEAGWSLNIFPAYPAQATETLALTYSGGSLQWRSLDEFISESEVGNGGVIPPPPPSGTPGWRQVERCDGKTMYVWGTEWES